MDDRFSSEPRASFGKRHAVRPRTRRYGLQTATPFQPNTRAGYGHFTICVLVGVPWTGAVFGLNWLYESAGLYKWLLLVALYCVSAVFGSIGYVLSIREPLPRAADDRHAVVRGHVVRVLSWCVLFPAICVGIGWGVGSQGASLGGSSLVFASLVGAAIGWRELGRIEEHLAPAYRQHFPSELSDEPDFAALRAEQTPLNLALIMIFCSVLILNTIVVLLFGGIPIATDNVPIGNFAAAQDFLGPLPFWSILVAWLAVTGWIIRLALRLPE